MGVAGCGKSSLGAALARATGGRLVEGDDFHSDENRERMRQGIALTDADRVHWLDALAAQLRANRHGAVLTCSALKAAFRDKLRAASPGLAFVHLQISPHDAAARHLTGQRAFLLRKPGGSSVCHPRATVWRAARVGAGRLAAAQRIHRSSGAVAGRGDRGTPRVRRAMNDCRLEAIRCAAALPGQSRDRHANRPEQPASQLIRSGSHIVKTGK